MDNPFGKVYGHLMTHLITSNLEADFLGRYARMKIFPKALLWSAAFEVLLLGPVSIANQVDLGAFDFVFGVLSYLALFCHAPGVWLLGFWPVAQDSLVFGALVQWCLWFTTFAVIFGLSHIFRKRSLDHEIRAA